MILKLNPVNLILAILIAGLGILVLIIAYRKLLSYMGKGKVVHTDFCVLYALENHISKGQVEFYFTSEAIIPVKFNILDHDMEMIKEIYSKDAKIGGNIIRFDTNELSDGTYFFELRTEKQRTMKKMFVKNT